MKHSLLRMSIHSFLVADFMLWLEKKEELVGIPLPLKRTMCVNAFDCDFTLVALKKAK